MTPKLPPGFEPLEVQPREWLPQKIVAAGGGAVPEPPPGFEPMEPSAGRSALVGAAHGATLGGGDEMFAALQGLWDAYTGKARDPAEAYARRLDQYRGMEKTAAEANPKAYLAGALGGGLATAPLLPVGAAAGAVGNIARGAGAGAGYGGIAGFLSGEGEGRLGSAATGAAVGGLAGGILSSGIEGGRAIARAYRNQGRAGAYGTIADDLPNGVDQFADEIAAGASRANVATNRRTLDILGEEMERANGNVAAAQTATIQRIVQETGLTPQTAADQIRRLTRVHEDSPLLLGEYPAVAGSDAAQRLRQAGNVDLDELGRSQTSTTQAALDYLANNGNAQSAQNVRNALTLRQEELAPQMRNVLEEMAPRVPTGARTTRPANITDVENLIAGTRQLAQQEYAQAYASIHPNSPQYQLFPRILDYYHNVAASRAPEVGNAIERAINQIEVELPNGQRGIQSLRQLQEGRTTMRGQMQAYRAQGRNDLAAAVQPLYRRITRVMESMSPDWARANARWADMQFDLVAQELGDAFAQRAGPLFREQMAAFRRMAPQAQEIVRIHFLQKQFDRLDNLGDTHSVSKLFLSDHARNMIRELFGNDAAVALTRAVRDQRVAEASQRMMQNSATHRRGVAQRQKDVDTGLIAAVENANTRGVRNWLLERLTQLLTERRNRPMAEVLTTPLRDTAAVARHLHNLRRQEAQLRGLNGPSRLTGPASAAVGSLIGSASGEPSTR